MQTCIILPDATFPALPCASQSLSYAVKALEKTQSPLMSPDRNRSPEQRIPSREASKHCGGAENKCCALRICPEQLGSAWIEVRTTGTQ